MNRYITHENLVADEEPWEPDVSIREVVPNWHGIQVELLTQETNLNEVNAKLRQDSPVGLVLMGSVVSRKARPSLIILTTCDKFYAIDGNDLERGIRFLTLKMRDDRVSFITTDGLYEADSLYQNYRIDLTLARAIDCTGINIHLMNSLKFKPQVVRNMYPERAGHQSNFSPKLESFENLIETWLDIPKEAIRYDANQLSHLTTKPLSLTAINIIKKRCILVRLLAETMNSFSWREVKLSCYNTFNKLYSCAYDEKVMKIMVQAITESKEQGEAGIGYYSYLDTGEVSDG